MSDSQYSFQQDLKNSIFNSDPKLDRNHLLIDIFKSYVAKLFEIVLIKNKEQNRLPFGALVEIKNNLISEFRKTELSEYQQSIEWYETLFDSTIKEIFNDAAHAHNGKDSVERSPQILSINSRAYINEGGLYVPSHLN